MTLTVHLPDDIATHENPAREALQALTLEAYRTHQLSSRQAREMLGMERLEFLSFLRSNNVMDHTYGMPQLLEDISTGDQLRQSAKLPG